MKKLAILIILVLATCMPAFGQGVSYPPPGITNSTPRANGSAAQTGDIPVKQADTTWKAAVVPNPANATATPTEAKIPIAGASPGYLDAWITPFLKLQATTPGTQQTGHINVSGSIISGALAALTTLAESWVGPSSTNGIYFKNGNVGIGTTDPAAKLDIKGTALFLRILDSGNNLLASTENSSLVGNGALAQFYYPLAGYTGKWAWPIVANPVVNGEVDHQINYGYWGAVGEPSFVQNIEMSWKDGFGQRWTEHNWAVTGTGGTCRRIFSFHSDASNPDIDTAAGFGIAGTGSFAIYNPVDISNIFAVDANAHISSQVAGGLVFPSGFGVGVPSSPLPAPIQYRNEGQGPGYQNIVLLGAKSHSFGGMETIGWTDGNGTLLTYAGISAGPINAAEGWGIEVAGQNYAKLKVGATPATAIDILNATSTGVTIVGNVGIGVTTPSQKLQVWGGNASVWDNTVLGAESLTDGTFTLEPGAGNWGVTAGWDATFANNKTNFNISGGAGDLTQAADKMVGAVSLVPNRWYKLTYTVSNSATSPAATITTAVASAATALTLTDGAQTTYFQSAAAPGTFTINATAGVFTLDGISLTELQGGSIALGAELKLGPTIIPPGATGNQTINKAAGRVNIAALGTSVTVTNNLVTANSTVVAVCATNDATAYVKNVVPGTGSFVITLGAGATAETAVNWIVFN